MSGAPLFQDLSLLTLPRSVVLIGASDRRDSIGGRVFYNLVEESDFTGELYLVNPRRSDVAGRPCHASVLDLPQVPDVAVVTIPAAAAVEALRQCADRGVRFAIVLSAGFGEAGEEGAALEEELRRIVAGSQLRIYGPNCPGLSNVHARLGFTFSPAFKFDLQSGPVGLATQGGGLGRGFLQSMDRGLGIGLWCSGGNEVDLEVSDFIHHMAGLPEIRVIAVLLEGIRNGAKFMAAVAHAADCGKPVVVLKVGKSEYGIRAAQSHTASIAGTAEVNSAVFRQLGVVEVDDLDELADTAWLLARRMPQGTEKVAVFATSGGTAALCADMVGQAGVELSSFAPGTTAALRASLPPFASLANPVDTTADVLADMAIHDRALELTCADPGTALVLYPCPIEYGQASTRMSEGVVRVQQGSPAVILPVWMSDRTGEGYRLLCDARLGPVRSLGKATKAIRRWIDYGRWRQQRDAGWTPLLLTDPATDATGAVRTLSEADAKALLAAAGIRVPASRVCRTPQEAVQAATALGFPVVAKVVSREITHKSEVGGVALGLQDAAAVEAAWHRIMVAVAKARPDATVDGLLIEYMAPAGGIETLIGVHRDPVLGHVLTFGLGGIYVEILKDVTRRLLPLSHASAQEMVREIRAYPLLAGARGRPPLDEAALVSLLLQVSDFVGRHARHIEEMDLNPVWLGTVGQGALPLDAVLVWRDETHT